MNRNRWIVSSALAVFLTLFGLMASSTVTAQQGGITRYTYDDNGRLRSVTLPSGETVVYQYDAAGNLVSITRQSAPVPTITGFTPTVGAPGTPVTVTGTNFDTVAANDTVRFNGAGTVAS